MSIEDKRRAAFEEFCVSDAGGYSERHLEKDNQGNYLVVWEYWAIWNAALDSVVIELPAPWAAQMLDGDQVLQDCRYAIESTGLGLRVKA